MGYNDNNERLIYPKADVQIFSKSVDWVFFRVKTALKFIGNALLFCVVNKLSKNKLTPFKIFKILSHDIGSMRMIILIGRAAIKTTTLLMVHQRLEKNIKAFSSITCD